mmetsp:Transcript_78171/g.137993  ORF Transcript_78171/g.137993 Transcript_78171/m.137993 type:complete len:224 (-) Transcript_78171:363-1034(-)
MRPRLRSAISMIIVGPLQVAMQTAIPTTRMRSMKTTVTASGHSACTSKVGTWPCWFLPRVLGLFTDHASGVPSWRGSVWLIDDAGQPQLFFPGGRLIPPPRCMRGAGARHSVRAGVQRHLNMQLGRRQSAVGIPTAGRRARACPACVSTGHFANHSLQPTHCLAWLSRFLRKSSICFSQSLFPNLAYAVATLAPPLGPPSRDPSHTAFNIQPPPSPPLPLCPL